MRRFGALTAIAAAFAVAAWAWVGGGEAPQLTLLSARGGDPIVLGPQYERPTLVAFWATTCTTCLQEMPRLARLYREFGPRGLDLIGVAMYYDPPARVLGLLEERSVPYPVALDLDRQALLGFGLEPVTPTTVLIAPGGRVVFRERGLLDMHRLRKTIVAMLPPA